MGFFLFLYPPLPPKALCLESGFAALKTPLTDLDGQAYITPWA